MTPVRHRTLPTLDLPGGPSAWSHRVPAVLLALAGAAVAGYLALYQAHAVQSVWDPLFGEGSERVLGSHLATMLPIPDALIGLAAYLLEAVLLISGGEDRWRSRPRVVLAGGVVVGLMAAGGLVLIAVQALWLRTGCTLCLASAAISLLLAGLAAPEIVATLRAPRPSPRGRSSAGTLAARSAATDNQP